MNLDKVYDIICADPPWDFNGQRQHSITRESGGAEVHYPTMKLKELKALDVPSIANDDCLLFMWSTSPHLDQAIELGHAWGFKYKTVAFVWNKMRTNPGHYTLSQCELCLVFKKGRIPDPRGERNVFQYLEVRRGSHSEKPAEVLRRIKAMFPFHECIELFARTRTPGWDAWGNQLEGDRT